MNAILALALLTNSFDMIGGSSPTFDMIGTVPKKVEETSDESGINSVDSLTVIVYVDLDSPRSFRRLSEDSDQIEGLTFKFRDKSRIPTEGRVYLSRSGTKLPLLQYHTDRGWVFDSDWKGAMAFANRWTSLNSSTELQVGNQDKPIGKTSQTQSYGSVGYPIRGGWWTGCSNWKHLTVGAHAGKFDQNWLRSLSNSQVQSLHSDDHEGRVKWQYVVRPGANKVVTSKPKSVRSYRSQNYFCPTGNCPLQRS